MNLIELTMPLNHQWMPDEVLPTAVKFFLGPKDHQEKGIVIGSETGTCLTLPSIFTEFRKTARIDQLPLEKLFLRSTAVVLIPRDGRKEISRADVENALSRAKPAKNDALLVVTGWGDKPHHELEAGGYLLQSPHFSPEAAKFLAERMKENDSDLLLTDTALIGWPGKHLIREWCSMLPTPSVESGEAKMYLHLYNSDKIKEDFAAELEFARSGIMTVRKLIRCGQIKNQRIKIIVSPLQIVRGVASTCRVVALEE